jgi:hypothetical protein
MRAWRGRPRSMAPNLIARVTARMSDRLVSRGSASGVWGIEEMRRAGWLPDDVASIDEEVDAGDK